MGASEEGGLFFSDPDRACCPSGLFKFYRHRTPPVDGVKTTQVVILLYDEYCVKYLYSFLANLLEFSCAWKLTYSLQDNYNNKLSVWQRTMKGGGAACLVWSPGAMKALKAYCAGSPVRYNRMAFSVKSAIASTLKNRASSESGKPPRKDARVRV